MAGAITWENINAPNFAGVSQGLAAAQQGIAAGLGQLGGAVQNIEATQEKSRLGQREFGTQDFLTKIADTYKTPESLAEASKPGGAIDQLKATYGANIDPTKTRGAVDELLSQRYAQAKAAGQYKDEAQQRLDRPLVGQILELSSSLNPADRAQASELLHSRPDLTNYGELAKGLGQSQYQDVQRSYTAADQKRAQAAADLAVKTQAENARHNIASEALQGKQVQLADRAQLFAEGRAQTDDIRALLVESAKTRPQTVASKEGSQAAAEFIAKQDDPVVVKAFNTIVANNPNAPIGAAIVAASGAVSGNWNPATWRWDRTKISDAEKAARSIESALPSTSEARKAFQAEIDLAQRKRDFLGAAMGGPTRASVAASATPAAQPVATPVQAPAVVPSQAPAPALAGQIAALQTFAQPPGGIDIRGSGPGGFGDQAAPGGKLLPGIGATPGFNRFIAQRAAEAQAAQKAANEATTKAEKAAAERRIKAIKESFKTGNLREYSE